MIREEDEVFFFGQGAAGGLFIQTWKRVSVEFPGRTKNPFEH